MAKLEGNWKDIGHGFKLCFTPEEGKVGSSLWIHIRQEGKSGWKTGRSLSYDSGIDVCFSKKR